MSLELLKQKQEELLGYLHRLLLELLYHNMIDKSSFVMDRLVLRDDEMTSFSLVSNLVYYIHATLDDWMRVYFRFEKNLQF